MLSIMSVASPIPSTTTPPLPDLNPFHDWARRNAGRLARLRAPCVVTSLLGRWTAGGYHYQPLHRLAPLAGRACSDGCTGGVVWLIAVVVRHRRERPAPGVWRSW